jgi:hypothetical protein
MADAQILAMWDQAAKKYEEVTKMKLTDLPRPTSVEDLISRADESIKHCEEFRARAGTFFKVLRNVGNAVETVSKIVAGVAQAAFPASPTVFGAVLYLIDAAKGVSKYLDAIVDLLVILQDFVVRLKIYSMVEISAELRTKLTEILVSIQQAADAT